MKRKQIAKIDIEILIVAASVLILMIGAVVLPRFWGAGATYNNDENNCYKHYCKPSVTPTLTPDPTATPEASLTPTSTIPPAPHGDGLSDGKGDGKSDGKSDGRVRPYSPYNHNQH